MMYRERGRSFAKWHCVAGERAFLRIFCARLRAFCRGSTDLSAARAFYAGFAAAAAAAAEEWTILGDA